MNALRILSLSSVFPNPREPQLGVFVRSRLERMAAGADVTVVAPVPALDYGNPQRDLLAGFRIPFQRQDGALKVLHPRWLYPPLVGAANGALLAARLLPHLARLRRTFPFQVIDAHFGHPEGVAAALLGAALDCPFTVTLRGNETAHGQHPWRLRALRWSLRRASRVIAVSDRLRDYAVSLGVAPHRARTIPNGIDAQRFRPRDRRACRERHGIPPDAPVLLSAGYLIERKGHHRTIEALAGLGAAAGNVLLLIAGGPGREGRYEERLRAQAAALPRPEQVRFLGRVSPDEMAELMSAADLLCLASSREGWPNVVHEAMGCGTPVVASDVGGVPDMVPDNRYGLVVPAGDAAALGVALGQAVARVRSGAWDREEIAAFAQARSWERVAADVLAEMRQVVAEAALKG